jgi:wyosine [tRNA(Phe)-imidazoG37] synthetase (radical SAM superfamily)
MKYLFGPVASRRFGRSLGINIIPHKFCTYDCIYCETGKTTNKLADRISFFDVADLIEEFKSVYCKEYEFVDIVTITGQGEPTLNADLEDIVDKLKIYLKHPLLVLTNGSLLYNGAVQMALSKADIVCTSLDAVSMKYFEEINRPDKDLNLGDIISGLIDFSYKYAGKLLIEVLLVKGVNDDLSSLKQIAGVIKKCKYDAVQLNTVFRPPAYDSAEAVSEEDLSSISKCMEMMGIRIQKPYNISSNNLKNRYENIAEYIVRLAAIRPVCFTDILKIVDMPKTVIAGVLNKLIVDGKIMAVRQKSSEYYITKK